MNFLRLRRTPKLAVPKHETDIFFVDETGVLKKMAPDGTVSEVGGGGGGGSTPVHTREEITGTDVTIANDGNPVKLPFEHQGGDALLDYTDPTQPTVIDTGMYAISVVPYCSSGPQESGWFDTTLFVSAANAGDVEVNTSLVLGTFPIASLWTTVYLEAGDSLALTVVNSGPDSLDFAISDGIVQRIY